MGFPDGTRGLLVVATVVVLAGCTGFVPADSADHEVPEGLGEVDNVSYDAELDVDPADGFTEAELERFVRRTMARIEVVRDLAYERPVEVEVFTRAEYRDWRASRGTRTAPDWENRIWKGLFLVGDDRDATRVFDEAFGSAVQGFYEPGRDRIVIVSDGDEVSISKHTLVHELVHALQDQRFGLEYGQESRDEQRAYETLVEGEAELVSRLYLEEWCERWSCLRPEREAGGGSGEDTTLDREIRLVLAQPYVQGVEYVDRLRSDGGWEAVNDRHEDPPRSSGATIYEGPTSPNPITVEDRSTAAWERFDHDPVGDTLGPGLLYAMFAANDVIEVEEPNEYAHPVAEGWTGDRLVPYRRGDTFGYVWALSWESPADAGEFADAYRDLLAGHGARARGTASYVVSDGPFAGAYRLTVDGTRVRIVHGPHLDALPAIDAR